MWVDGWMDVGDGWMEEARALGGCVCTEVMETGGRERLWLGWGRGRGANAGWVFELLSYDAYKGLPKKKKTRAEIALFKHPFSKSPRKL